MFYKLLLLVLVVSFISIHEANAQVTAGLPPSINQTQCDVLSFNNVENPFQVTVDHDPALSKSITYATTNPDAALQLVGTDPTKQLGQINPKTHLSFSSNDTTNWTIVVQLTHPDNKVGPRTMIANLFAHQSNLVASHKVLYYGTNVCVIFQIQAVPPVHIPTNQEILSLAAKMENLTVGNVVGKVQYYAEKADQSSSNTGFEALVILLFGIVFFILNRADRRKLASQEHNAKLATEGWKNATAVAKFERQHFKLEINDMKNRYDGIFGFVLEQMVSQANNSAKLVYDAITDLALFLKTQKIESIRVLPEPTEIILPTVDETEMPPEKKKDLKSKIPILGDYLEKRDVEKKKLSDRAEFYYNEYRKNMEKYKGQFQKMSDEFYPLAEKGDAEARAKVDAMYKIIQEDGRWP